MELALEAGADDVQRVDDEVRDHLRPDALPRRGQGLGRRRHHARGQHRSRASPRTPSISADPDAAQKVLKLMERLDDHDDVQNVSANFYIPDDVMKAIGEG